MPNYNKLTPELIRRGHDVVVVDQQAEGANTSRACVIHPRTLEMLERLGVTKQLVDDGRARHLAFSARGQATRGKRGSTKSSSSTLRSSTDSPHRAEAHASTLP